MSDSDDREIEKILKEIDNITFMMKRKTRKDLEDSLTLERAVSMTLGIIGESVAKLSKEFKDTTNEIPWKKIKGLRNWIVHRYDDLDFEIIYSVVKEKLPAFKAQLEQIQRIREINQKFSTGKNTNKSAGIKHNK